MAYLGVSRSQGGDAAAAGISELDRRRSHPARCSGHEQRLACIIMAAIEKPVIGRQEVEDKRRSACGIKGIGHCHAAFGADDRLFGEPAAELPARDALAFRKALDTIPHRLDAPDNLASRNEGQRRLHLVKAAHHECID